jgi:hypothetical protein
MAANDDFLMAVWRVIHRADLERCRAERCGLAYSWEFDNLREEYEAAAGKSASGTISDQPWWHERV